LNFVLKTEFPKLEIEIIVFDNVSIDGSREIVKKEYPEVILIKNKKNVGFCEGNNTGIEKSTGDLVVLMNNDTVVNKKRAYAKELKTRAGIKRIFRLLGK